MPTLSIVSFILSSRMEMTSGWAVAIAASNSLPTLEKISRVATLT